MSDSHALDPILKGRNADPAVREGIALVEYPEYLITEALNGDGLRQVHGRLATEGLTPEAAARVITEMIVGGRAEDIAERPQRTREKSKASFVPHFPQPVISRLFGKKTPANEEPVFDDDPAPINFSAPVTTSLLMRVETVTQLWRQGKIDAGRAIHLLDTAMTDFHARE